MKIRFSTVLTLISSLSVFACSAESGSDQSTSSDPLPPARETPSASSPSPAPPLPHAPGRPGPARAGISTTSSVPGVTSLRIVAAASVSTNATSYAYGDAVSVSFAGLPGNARDWIGFAPAGSAATAWAWYAYTAGSASGTVTTESGDFLPPGTYVARAFADDGYTLLAESASFTVGAKPTLTASVTMGKTAYTGFETMRAAFSGVTPNATVRVGIHPTYGSTRSPWTYVDVQADANGTGSADLADMLAGEWETRVFEGTAWKGTSALFQVIPAVRTDKTSYVVGERVTVDFAGMQGFSMNDAVALALASSANDQFVSKTSVNWYWSGSKQINTTGLSPGTYVARVFFDFSTTAKAQSTTFTIE